MKKLIPIILIIALILSLTSCGKPKEVKELEKLTKALSEIAIEEGEDLFSDIADSIDDIDYGDFSDDDIVASSDVEAGNTPGSELSDFFNFYDTALDPFEEAINNWEADDFFMFDAALDYMSPSLHFLSMSLYDVLYLFGADEGEYREVNGNIIEFGKEYAREEDGYSPNDKKGDVYVEKGILDNSAKTLFFESYVARDGEKLSRGISEVVCLSDGTFIVQTLRKDMVHDERLEDKGDAYFMVFNKDRLEVIKATFAPDVNFTYKSIIGNGKTTVEDMAQGYTLIRKMTVADNVAKVDKY